MTEKRYALLYGVDENPYEWDIIDNEKNSIITQGNGISICKALNELHEENQAVKDIINELNSMDFYSDSALLGEYIGKIARTLGVDYE